MHVRGRIAVHGQHLVVAEYVIAGAVLGKIGVFQGGDTHALGYFSAFLGRNFRAVGFGVVVGRYDLSRAANGLIQQAFQADSIAGSGFKGPAIFTQHRAETDVLKLDLVISPPLCRRKKLLEMQALPMIDDVQNGVRAPGFHAITDGGQIGGGI